MIQLGERSGIKFSLSLVSLETGKANKNVLNENCTRVREGKHLSDLFPIKNGLKKKEKLYRHCCSSLL